MIGLHIDQERVEEKWKTLLETDGLTVEECAYALARFVEEEISKKAQEGVDHLYRRINKLEKKKSKRKYFRKYVRLTHTVAVLRGELRIAYQTLERAATQTGYEAWGCPLCEYKEGVFVKPCSLHKRIMELEDHE